MKTDDKEQAKKLNRRQDYKRKKSTGGSLKLPAAGCRESSILKAKCLSSSLADPAASSLLDSSECILLSYPVERISGLFDLSIGASVIREDDRGRFYFLGA